MTYAVAVLPSARLLTLLTSRNHHVFGATLLR